MKPKSETRCFWFEDDGTPIKKSGCPSGNLCGFAHPTDDNWDRLPRQLTRPYGYPARDFGRDKDDGYDSPPPRRRRRSRYRSESRSRSPSRHRSRESKYISRSPVQSRSGEKDGRQDRMVVDYPHTKSKRSVSSSTSRSVQAATAAPLCDGSSSTSMVVTNGTSNVLPTPPSSGTIMPPIFNQKVLQRPTPTGPSALRNVSSPKNALDPPDVISDKNSPPVVLDERVPGLRFVKLPSIARPSTSTTVQVPPQPVSTPPCQPPPPPRYPLPGAPEGLSIKIPTRVVEPIPADKRKIWEERIKLFADAYQAKRDLERSEQMYKYAIDISQSNLFPSLSDDEKGKYNAELAEVIANRDKVKKTHDDAVERLIQQGSWPLGPPPSTKADEQGEQERRDILRHVQELNDTAQKMSEILGEIAMKSNPPTLFLPAGDDDDDDIYADPMDMDDNLVAGTPKMPVADASGSLPSRKRQRLSEGQDVAIRPVVDPDLPTREELEVYRIRLEKLEGKIIDLDNELNQYEEEVKSSFKDELENRISEYNTERKQKEKERREKEKKIREEEMTKVNADAEGLENDVKEVGDEIAEVITKIESLKIQLVEETNQRDSIEKKVAQVNEHLHGYVKQRDSNVRTMQTLEAALKAYLSSVSRPSPPATPSSEEVAPTSAYILSQLQEPILQAIRQHLQPMLTQSRIDTEALVRERNMEIVRKIWPRMELVSRLLANVADKLDRESIIMTPVTPAPPLSNVPTHSLHPVPQSIQHQQQAFTNQHPAGYQSWSSG